MEDYGHRYADKKISAVDRELKKTYRTAQRELKKKLADFNKRFEKKEKMQNIAFCTKMPVNFAEKEQLMQHWGFDELRVLG